MNLSNAELMLLELVAEQSSVSGYEISRIVSLRGYKNWADIGNTSIYTGLKKLKSKGLLDSQIDSKKKGKGPLPTKFKINKSGKKMLEEKILNSFEEAKVNSGRFLLGLAGLPFTEKNKVVIILEKKNRSALKDHEMVKKKFLSDGGDKLDLNTKEVFRHSFFFMEKSIEFIDSLIKNLKKE